MACTIPLAVRTPYFNSYLRTETGRNHTNDWPQFWNLGHVVAWDAWIMVDGVNLQLFGGAGAMDVTVTFLSPIEPEDLVLQSLPFTYLYIDAKSRDGSQHSIQLYSDVTGEWLSNDLDSQCEWATIKSSSLLIHRAALSKPSSMKEVSDIAEDTTLYYAFPNGKGVTYRTGDANVSRPQWAKNKALENSEDTNFRAISNAYPTFSFALDLGTISSTSESVMWALGLTRDPSIKYTAQDRHAYYWTKYSNVGDAVTAFVSDFDNARDRAVALDNKLMSAAKDISDEYAIVVSVAARQAMAGVEITVSKDSDGNWNQSDIMSFMKDLGVSQRVNPVDVMYAAFPAFLTINATWAGYLLEPLLRLQRENITKVNYAMPDMGESFPTATAHLSPPVVRSVENSGDMLFMVWAHATISGDASLIKSYYSLLKMWADYLISTKATPSGFTDADGIDNANLGLKGIIGIKCMAQFADALGKSMIGNATSYINEWISSAVVDGHIVSGYGDSSSWGLIYNLYADRILGTNLINESLYSAQDSFYDSKLASDGRAYGIAYDSSISNNAKSTWTMFAAGATSDPPLRDDLISGVFAKASSNATAGVFPTTYDIAKGTIIEGAASPAQGAMFRYLHSERQTPTGGSDSSNPADGSGGSSSSSSAGAIAGGVVGGLVILGLAAAGVFFYRRRRRTSEPKKQHFTSSRDNSFPGSDTQLLALPTVSGTSSSSGRVPLAYEPQHHVEPFEPSAIPPNYKRSAPSASTMQNPTSSPTDGISVSSPSQSGSAGSGSDSERLRNEMESLRREMNQIREQTMYVPPPEYDP
ncbi:hypothetical protein CPB85DRAFT_1438878 [Mucidula mucida]|nr:hypothetical protein CPB85DRAFT_1438878 [Mucidula mucida]